MTERLYYDDSYLTQFRASVVDASPDSQRVYLDRTAFYPTSGGQPFDIGTLGEAQVTEVVDEGERIAHVLSQPLADRQVNGAIDWRRRFDHMQQHTGQHLLSAVLIDLFDAATVSFHLGQDSSTIDVTKALKSEQLREAELRANAVVFENRPVAIERRDSSEALDLRKPTEREGPIRIVSIDGLDRSACGGTHVRATGEIGGILLRKTDRIRGNLRIEFLCGERALRQARADFETLSSIARVFSAPLKDTPSLVAAQQEKLVEMERARLRVGMELAEVRGRSLYANTALETDGFRRIERRVPQLTEELRAEAQSFTTGPKSVFLAICENPASILLSVSKDSGLNAGAVLKKTLADVGGRGGGSAVLAQGSLTSVDDLDRVASALLESCKLAIS